MDTETTMTTGLHSAAALHGPGCSPCGGSPLSHHVLEARCLKQCDHFGLFGLPLRLPRRLTLRFAVPEDINAGDILRINGDDYAIRFYDMQPSTGLVAAAGAVVQCEVDTARGIAFFPSGDAVCGCVFPPPMPVFYVDPNGDIAPNTPGTQNAPFRSLAAGIDILTRRQIPTCETITFMINPGTYPAEELQVSVPKIAGGELVIRGSDPANRPDIHIVGKARFRNGWVTINDINLQTEEGLSFQQTVGNTANMTIGVSKPSNLVHVDYNSMLYLMGGMEIDCNGIEHFRLFNISANSSLIHAGDCSINNAVRFTNYTTFVIQNSSYYLSDGGSLSYNTGITGTRFTVSAQSVIFTRRNDPNFFPGDVAGVKGFEGGYY